MRKALTEDKAYMTEGENNCLKLAGAFVAGGLIGAALAVFLAPAPGEETRVKIGDLLEMLKEKAGEAPEAPAAKFTADSEHGDKLAEEIRRRKEYLFRNAD